MPSSTNLGLHVNYDFDKMSLSWWTGFKDHDYLYNEDYDGTPINAETYRQDQKGDYLQTELRLISNSDGPLSWYAGVSFYKEKIDVDFLSTTDEDVICSYYGYYYGVDTCSDYFDYWQAYYDALYPGDYVIGPFMPSSNGRIDERNIVNGRYQGWAAYVDLSYAINDLWDVSLGVRYTYDEKEFSSRGAATGKHAAELLLVGLQQREIDRQERLGRADATVRGALPAYRRFDGVRQLHERLQVRWFWHVLADTGYIPVFR